MFTVVDREQLWNSVLVLGVIILVPRVFLANRDFINVIPYTLFIDACTTAGSLSAFRAASSTLNVPSAFTLKSVRGSCIEAVTAT